MKKSMKGTKSSNNDDFEEISTSNLHEPTDYAIEVPPINNPIGSQALTSGLEKVISDCADKNIMIGTQEFHRDPAKSAEVEEPKFYRFTSKNGENISVSPPCTNDTLGNNRANPVSGTVTMAEIMKHVSSLYNKDGKYIGGDKEMRIIVPTNDIKRKHWVTNEIKIGPNGIEINTYDSMDRLPLLSRIANKISHFFNDPKKDAINAFKDQGIKSPKITSKLVNTGTQKDDTNCGRHTLANIESLVQTGKPYTEKDQKKIETKLGKMQESMKNPDKINRIEAHNNEAQKNTSPPLNKRQQRNTKLSAQIEKQLLEINKILNRKPKKENSHPTTNKRNNSRKEHGR